MGAIMTWVVGPECRGHSQHPDARDSYRPTGVYGLGYTYGAGLAARREFGPFTAIRGSLGPDDPCTGYVRGPLEGESDVPLISFWRWPDAVAWARREAEALEATQ